MRPLRAALDQLAGASAVHLQTRHRMDLAMKAMTRRYQVIPGWWFCKDCPAGADGSELQARAHVLVTGHAVRYTRAAVIHLNLNGPAIPARGR